LAVQLYRTQKASLKKVQKRRIAYRKGTPKKRGQKHAEMPKKHKTNCEKKKRQQFRRKTISNKKMKQCKASKNKCKHMQTDATVWVRIFAFF